MFFLIISIIIISIIGTLSHFLYDITNHNKIVGLFSAVNESTWEHIKIALTPTILWCLVDGLIFGNNPNYFVAKFVSLLIIYLLMPLLYYGHKAIFKKDIFIFDIISFYIVIIASQYSFYYFVNTYELDFVFNYLGCIGVFLLFGGYMIHTLMPPKSELFKDPITKKYGFKAHSDVINSKKN